MQARFNNSNYVNKKMCTLFFLSQEHWQTARSDRGEFREHSNFKPMLLLRAQVKTKANECDDWRNELNDSFTESENKSAIINCIQQLCVCACVYCMHL